MFAVCGSERPFQSKRISGGNQVVQRRREREKNMTDFDFPTDTHRQTKEKRKKGIAGNLFFPPLKQIALVYHLEEIWTTPSTTTTNILKHLALFITYSTKYLGVALCCSSSPPYKETQRDLYEMLLLLLPLHVSLSICPSPFHSWADCFGTMVTLHSWERKKMSAVQNERRRHGGTISGWR